MAPFRRGKAQAARRHGAQVRGGKSVRRGGRTSTGKSVSFSRVEGQPEAAQGESTDESVSEPGAANEIAASSESDGEEENARSYNSLLQSLSANIQRGQPQRKKRKLEEPSIENEAPTLDDLQDALETDDFTTAETEVEGNGLDEEVDDVEGISGPFQTAIP